MNVSTDVSCVLCLKGRRKGRKEGRKQGKGGVVVVTEGREEKEEEE